MVKAIDTSNPLAWQSQLPKPHLTYSVLADYHAGLHLEEVADKLQTSLLDVFNKNLWPVIAQNMAHTRGKAYKIDLGSSLYCARYCQSISNYKGATSAQQNDRLEIIFSGLSPTSKKPAPRLNGFQQFIHHVTGKKVSDSLFLPLMSDEPYHVLATGIHFLHDGQQWQYHGGGVLDDRLPNHHPKATYGVQIFSNSMESLEQFSVERLDSTKPQEKLVAAKFLLNHLTALENSLQKDRVKVEGYCYT